MGLLADIRAFQSNPGTNSAPAQPNMIAAFLLIFAVVALCITWLVIFVVIHRFVCNACQRRREEESRAMIEAVLRRARLQAHPPTPTDNFVRSGLARFFQTEANQTTAAPLPSYDQVLTLSADETLKRQTIGAATDADSRPPTYTAATSRL